MAPCTAVLMPPIVSNSSTVSSMLWPAPLTLSRSCCAASMLARQHATRHARESSAAPPAPTSRSGNKRTTRVIATYATNEPQIHSTQPDHCSAGAGSAGQSYLILSIGQSKQRAGSGRAEPVGALDEAGLQVRARQCRCSYGCQQQAPGEQAHGLKLSPRLCRAEKVVM